MWLFKILLWLTCYFILYILFSLNTLISIFCFIIVIIITSIFLLQLHIEYLTFLILLLYLGGILIFFLFTSLMLSNEYNSQTKSSLYSTENIVFIFLFVKIYYWVNLYNFKLCTFLTFNTSNNYYTNYISDNYSYIELLNNQHDVLILNSLYSNKIILLFLLGMILLFTMVGVIVITKEKNV